MVKKFSCPHPGCNTSSTRAWNIHRHLQRKHLNSDFSENCLLCGKTFTEPDVLQKHLIIDHGPSDKFYEHSSAFKRDVIVYRYNYKEDVYNFKEGQVSILDELKEHFRWKLENIAS